MPDIRLVATDLDGTLVYDSHCIPERCRAAIAEARARGVHVCLATGRMHHSAEDFARDLGLLGEPVISYNGAMVRVAGTGETLWHERVPTALAQRIVQQAAAEGRLIHYYVDDVMYVTRVSKGALIYEQRTGSRPVPVGDVRRLTDQAPTKILLVDEPEAIGELLRRDQAAYGDEVYVTRSLPEYVEYLSPRATKGAALRVVREHFGLAREQVLACGDMLNDIPLLQEAGVAVAMAHAPEEVRAVADYVTAPGLEGVAEAIEKYVLGPAA